jgi:F-type H+-transporting ATPase subunit a
MNLYINSPLEQFEVLNLISLNAPILGYLNFSLTNLALYSLIVLSILVGLHVLGNNDVKLIPSRWSIALETSYASILSIVREQLGANNEGYFPLVYTIFFFIIIANLVGNVPYSFTVTTSIIVSLGLSVIVFIAVTVLGLVIHRLGFFSLYVPGGTPLALVPLLVWIELISYFARAISLGVRLFANMVAGHSLLKILATFLHKMITGSVTIAIFSIIPFVLFLAIIGLELGVSIVQAAVFTLLVCSYIKNALELH